MKRIDRISAILIQLQSRRVVKAKDIAERFSISLRTVYRDIRTLEEAGIPIEVDGIVRLEHLPARRHTRVRLIVSAVPTDETPPKAEPDEESLGAGWFTLEEMKALPLRGPDVREIFSYVSSGGAIAPRSMLAWEGAPFDTPSP